MYWNINNRFFLKCSTLIIISICLFSCTSEKQNNKNIKLSTGNFDIKSNSPKLSLNGEWMFCFDPRSDLCALKDAIPLSDWSRKMVPCTYNMGEKKYYQGKTWYKKSFKLSAGHFKNKQAMLRFLGVALRSKIWVNGFLAGENHFGWIPFEIDISDHLKAGQNEIIVMVDNEILAKAIPDSNWDGWWYYGGIYRDVYIDFRPACNISNLYLETAQAKEQWDFSIKVQLHNSLDYFKMTKAETAILDNKNNILFKKSRTVNLQPGNNLITFNDRLRKVKEWSPKNPDLYRLICKLKNDSEHKIEIQAAFREIKIEGSQILLNSKPLVIRGINVHEEHPDYGNALPRSLIKSTLDDIEKLNVNFVRTGHYTQHPYFYEICNEKGFIVWTEIPAWKTKTESLSDPEIYQLYGKEQLKAMVEQYRKYPSIAIWSIGNEFKSDRPAALEYVKKTVSLVKSMDSTRLVTFASDRHRGKDSISGVSDLCYDQVDIIALNEYYGWYYGTDSDLGPKLDEIHALHPQKPIVISELGAGAAPDGNIEREKYHSRKNYSLIHQCEHLKEHLEQIYAPSRKNYVSGAMIWVYADFYDPHRIKSTHPTAWKGVNLKGLVSLQRKKKPSYKIVSDFYQNIDKDNKP